MYEDEDLQEIHEDIIELNEDISDLRRDLDNISASVEGSGENVALNGTAEARFKNPPLPMGNSEQNGEPAPDNEVPIINVTGDVEVVVENKNLFDINSFESQLVSGKIINDNGVEVNDATSSYSRYKLFLRKNVTYYIKGAWQKIYYYDMNGNLKSRSSAFNGADRSYTPSENEYIGFQIGNTYWSSNKGQEQIEKNLTSTPYTPHKEQVLPLTLGNIELCKIGDYQDYFYKESNKWYKCGMIGKIVYDGVNKRVIYKHNSITSDTKGFYQATLTNKISGNSGDTTYGLSNYLRFISGGASTAFNNNSSGIWWEGGNSTYIYLILEQTSLQDVNNWLSENNLIIYYVLANPVITEITDTTLINELEDILNALSYEEQTSISSNTIALFNIKAFRNMNTSIESLQSRIELLKGRS